MLYDDDDDDDDDLSTMGCRQLLVWTTAETDHCQKSENILLCHSVSIHH